MRPSVSITKPDPTPCGRITCPWPVRITARLVMFTTDAPFCWYTCTAGFDSPGAVCASARGTAIDGTTTPTGDEAGLVGARDPAGCCVLGDAAGVEATSRLPPVSAVQAANSTAVVAEL